MGENPKRPNVLLLTSNWINMLGVALVTTAGFSWLFVLPTQLRGHTENPYIGIVVFIFIPVIFIAGLVLIAVGVFLGRRIQRGLSLGGDRRAQLRNLALFFAGTTAVNIIIGTQGTYRAVRPWRPFSFAGKAAT